MIILWLYRSLWWFFLPVIILHRVIRDRKNPEGLGRITERFAIFKKDALPKNGILIHAVSLGEVRAITPLVEKLQRKYPDIPLIMTCMTLTGSAQITTTFGSRVTHVFLPFDHRLMMKFFLNHCQPRLIIVMETEIWPNFMMQAKTQAIPFYLINARLSPNSFKNYQKIHTTMCLLLTGIKILAQSSGDRDRFLALGAQPDDVECVGNLKYDMTINLIRPDTQTEGLNQPPTLLNQLHHSIKNRLIWVMASTHHGEDTFALTALKILKQKYPSLLLILVPRHPERFDAVYLETVAQAFSVIKRSQLPTDFAESLTITQDVMLVDSIGELLNFYALADVVCVGGSFVPVGGHNILEPAFFKKPIITGNSQYNFSDISQLFQKNDAVIICESHELANQVAGLFSDKDRADQLAANAYQCVISHQGALKKTLAALAGNLNKDVKTYSKVS